jgi:hypothetical protein
MLAAPFSFPLLRRVLNRRLGMANLALADRRIAQTFARWSTALLVFFSSAAPAFADPIKYALVDAMFNDGGQATGYVLYETRPAPEAPRVTDWAISVTTGTSVPFFTYDPTNSTVSFTPDLMTFVSLPSPFLGCGGQLRRVQFDLLQFGAQAGETCQATRQFVSGTFQQQPGPVLTLKADRQHPASRVVYGGSSILVTLDISPAGVTTPLDWYFAIVFEGIVRWVTANGVFLTPTPLAHTAPVLISDVPLLFSLINGNTATRFVIIAADGSNVVAYDHITFVVPPSP